MLTAPASRDSPLSRPAATTPMANLFFIVFVAAYVVLILCLLVVSCTVLAWMFYGWGAPERTEQAGVPRTMNDPRHRFSLTRAPRHEEAVLGVTLDELTRVDHPAFEVIVVVGHDDPGTATVAEQWARRNPELGRVVIDWNWPKNKPKALNTALPHCRGDVVGIFDAED